MPKYVNQLEFPQFIETTITRGGKIVGTIRVKPSGVSWRPSGQHKYYSVSFDEFSKWITSPETKSRKATRW